MFLPIGIGNSFSLAQFNRGVPDASSGVKSADAGNAVAAVGQLLMGIQTALAPIGDFAGFANLTAAATSDRWPIVKCFDCI